MRATNSFAYTDGFYNVLIDETDPVSKVDPLAIRQTSDSFTVSVTGHDPNAPNGTAGSGVAFYDLYVAVDGGFFGTTPFATLPATNPSFTFTALEATPTASTASPPMWPATPRRRGRWSRRAPSCPT